MQQIMALQDRTKRPKVVDDKAQQLEGTSRHEEASVAAMLTPKMRKKKAAQPKGRGGKKVAV